jgi:predicted outer membrane repeat protein
VDGEFGSDSNAGTSWGIGNALATIQEAINRASPGAEIWVKKGTYDISSTGTINVNKIVHIYGGFATDMETARDERDWVNNVTIVDGQNLVRCFTVGADATIDGLTITRGVGSGIFIANSTSTIANCTFSGNDGLGEGGAIKIGGISSVSITNCTFSGNHAGDEGGAIYISGAAPVVSITNCIFVGNDSGRDGGAIVNYSDSTAITNCTFSGNTAQYGGAIYNNNSSPTITNSILWGDRDWGPSVSEIYDSGTSNPIVTYSLIEGGYSAGTDIIDADPLFVDAASGDFRLRGSSLGF